MCDSPQESSHPDVSPLAHDVAQQIHSSIVYSTAVVTDMLSTLLSVDNEKGEGLSPGVDVVLASDATQERTSLGG